MGEKTKIEWCDATWNPIRARHKETGQLGWHCTKPSTGCKHCYAEAMNKWRGTGLPFVPASLKNIELSIDEKVLARPLHWRKPKKIFVCDMTDLFQEDIPDSFIDAVTTVMCEHGEGADGSHHTYQILTKRPKRMMEYAKSRELDMLPNVWLGVSVEDQAIADERIPILLQTPAAVRFISAEPLLGPVSIKWYLERRYYQINQPMIPALDWVIIGGESGPGARPCDLAWIRSIKDQCQAVQVPVFVKQVGTHPCEQVTWAGQFFHHFHGTLGCKKLKDKKGGDPQEWPSDLRAECRQYPSVVG